MIDALISLTLAFWFLFYLLNHAEMFDKLRAAVIPALPSWLAYPLQCAFCLTAWTLIAFSLFTGWSPLVIMTPPCTLLLDLTYRRLKGDK